MKPSFSYEISHFLVKLKVISEKEAHNLERAFKESDRDQFIDFLYEQGLVAKENLLKALADYYQVPSFDVEGYFFDTFLLRKFPKDFLLRNGIIPLEVDENILVMVASNPNDPKLLPAIGEHVSYDIQFRVGLRLPITDMVKEFYEKAITQGFPNEPEEPKSDQFDEDFKDVLEEEDF